MKKNYNFIIKQLLIEYFHFCRVKSSWADEVEEVEGKSL